ncbi:MAG TPA: DUF1080 domain-containing protein [Terracidiphilus sp.]|nr:DUF1080 domain-containing protein [Terracidiphilus sp.]
MSESAGVLNRRDFIRKGMIAAGGCMLGRSPLARAAREKKTVLFNGRTLDGWIMAENSQISIWSGDITNLAELVKAITSKSNGVAAYLDSALDEAVKGNLAAFNPSNEASVKATGSALARSLTAIIKGPSVYDKSRFAGIHLQSETEELALSDPQGLRLVETNRALLVDAFPGDISPVKPGWTVKDGVVASTGSGRGVFYSARDYGRFRWMFKIRHVSGDPDHQACVLIFCARPAANEIPLDAIGGIQFQVPRGGHWDYRPGHNNAGEGEFSPVTKVSFDPHQWSSVEIVADASKGAARMAVAQPVGSKAVEVLDFNDPTAGKIGPIALQMHNAGLFDEYKDLTIEVNPQSMSLITTS